MLTFFLKEKKKVGRRPRFRRNRAFRPAPNYPANTPRWGVLQSSGSLAGERPVRPVSCDPLKAAGKAAPPPWSLALRVQEAAPAGPVLKGSRSRGCPWGRLVPAALVSSMKTSQERIHSFLSWLVLFSVPRPVAGVLCGLGLAGFWRSRLGVFRPVRRAARDAVPGLCRPL